MTITNYSSSTDPPECTRGFVNDNVLDYIMNATQLTTHSNLLHFRGIRVTCSGASINKWIVGATTSLQVPPQILLCDFDSPNSCDHFELAMLNTTSHLNVYEFNHAYMINDRRQFLKVESSQIYYQRCALGRCLDRPLVAVELTGEYRLWCVYCLN